MKLKGQKLFENPISLESIKARVDLARMEVYRCFIREKSPEDIYIESFLNCFIALVQYPVSFVVFDRSFNPKFHFCSDKEHRHWFEEMVSKVKWSKENTYELFSYPDFEDKDKRKYKYVIAVILMGSKFKNKADRSKIIDKEYSFKNIDSHEKYISICASEFFENPWIGFSTVFSNQFFEALNLSIESVSKNHIWGRGSGIAKWPPDENEIISYAGEVGLPNDKLDTWKNVLSEIFCRAFSSSDYGYETISRISHTLENFESLRQVRQPTNMMIAYRTFSIEDGGLRHENSNGGYSYDTHFLIPRDGDTGSSYLEFFNDLKIRYTGRNKVNIYNSQGRCFYRELYNIQDLLDLGVSEKKAEIFSIAAEEIDKKFWEVLSSEGGHKKILKILGKKAGKHVRSLVDPVYYTGLVHINPIFEFWGLDRVDQRFFEKKVSSFENFSEEVSDDLLRIVSLYYLLSSAASWEQIPGSENKPQRLSAFLMPVKMRGSVWGVTIHAFYTPEFSNKFSSNPAWISGFLLATASRQKNQTLFDRILWDNAQRRVSSLLIRHIGECNISGFFDAINIINRKLEGEQLLTPYAYPQFEITRADSNSSKSYYEVENGKGKSLRFSWVIDENFCFSARQPWSGEGTRDFKKAVELGVDGGLKMMYSSALGKENK